MNKRQFSFANVLNELDILFFLSLTKVRIPHR